MEEKVKLKWLLSLIIQTETARMKLFPLIVLILSFFNASLNVQIELINF